jgi:branched-chain amino acid aminotransferase
MRLHGMCSALNYGQQAFEGLKAFRSPDGSISVFRPERNARRMNHSAEVLSMPAVPEDVFVSAVRAAVAHNAEFVPPHETGAALYIRPQIYGSSAQLGLTAPEEYLFCVFVVPTGTYHGAHPVKALILDEFDRAAPNGVGHAKAGGNYAPVLRWSDAARDKGYGITMHLDSLKHEEVDEFSTSGFLGAKKDGEQITIAVPDSKCVIDSVTSSSIQELAQSFGWKVERRPIKYTELPEFTEVMAAGTAAALVPIRSITRSIAAATDGKSLSSVVGSHERLVVNGDEETVVYVPDSVPEAGPIATRLLSGLQGIQLGKIEDSFGWNTKVEEADKSAATVEA